MNVSFSLQYYPNGLDEKLLKALIQVAEIQEFKRKPNKAVIYPTVASISFYAEHETERMPFELLQKVSQILEDTEFKILGNSERVIELEARK